MVMLLLKASLSENKYTLLKTPNSENVYTLTLTHTYLPRPSKGVPP